MRHRFLVRAGLMALAFCALAAQAGESSRQFNVVITLNRTPGGPGVAGQGPDAFGRCTSSALSSATGAVVQVVCQTGQFVSIAPDPSKPFLGTHGAAFRFSVGSGGAAMGPWQTAGSDPFAGASSMTAMRIFNDNDNSASSGPVEMLVSF